MSYKYCLIFMMLAQTTMTGNSFVKPRKEKMSSLRESCCQHATDALARIPEIMRTCAKMQEELTAILQEYITGDAASIISAGNRDELKAATEKLEAFGKELDKGIKSLQITTADIKQRRIKTA